MQEEIQDPNTDVKIQQEVKDTLIPQLLKRLKDVIKSSNRPKDIADLGKLLLALAGMDKKDTTNVNLGTVVNFNMSEGSLRGAMGLMGKMTNIQPDKLEQLTEKLVGSQQATKVKKSKPTSKPKRKKNPTTEVEGDYGFLE